MQRFAPTLESNLVYVPRSSLSGQNCIANSAGSAAEYVCSSIELRPMYGLLAFLFAAYPAIHESYIIRWPSAPYDRRT